MLGAMRRGVAMALVSACALGLGPAAFSAPAPAASASAASATPPASASAPAPTPAAAPAAGPTPTPAFDAAAAARTLAQIERQRPTTASDRQLLDMETQAAAIEAQAEKIVAAHAGALAQVERSLRRYPIWRVRRLRGEEKQDWQALEAQRAGLLAQTGPARALASEAGRAYSLVAQRRREGFSARVLQRSPSPLSPTFWTSLQTSIGRDWARLDSLADRSLAFAERAPFPQGPLRFAGGVVAALILLVPVRLWLEGLVRRRRRPAGGAPTARSTLAAAWTVVVDVGSPTLAAIVIQLSAQWGDLLSGNANALSGAVVRAVAWAAAILAIGRVLAADKAPERRFLKVTDDDASRIGLALWAVAIVSAAGFVVRSLNFIIGASVAATIATNCGLSLAYAAGGGLMLLSYGGGAGRAAGDIDAPMSARSPAWTLISLALTVAIAATVVAVFAGYTTLASLISGQMFWLSLIACMTFLLLRLIDDLFTALLRRGGRASLTLGALFGVRSSTIAQAGLLVCAALQVAVLVAALTLALTPFGQSGELLISNIGRLGGAIRIGKAVISPGAIAAGFGAFAIGIGIVHLVRAWVVRRYLPVTGWDSGVRNSISTGVGYVGFAITLVSALTVMGLGFQQIALIASALSVGIGFGLQQVVQNFVSGIILLIERPVKVGDWVNVGGVEGDIRRIRVRATEIETFDRSTVIVPNSSLITSNVQNKTRGSPRGRIQLQLAIAKAADAQTAQDLIMGAARAKPEILEDPEPAIYVDSLAAGGGLSFNCHFYVANPRDAYRVRSALLLQIVGDFAKNGVALA